MEKFLVLATAVLCIVICNQVVHAGSISSADNAYTVGAAEASIGDYGHYFLNCTNKTIQDSATMKAPGIFSIL